jgi:hypothetical protein
MARMIFTLDSRYPQNLNKINILNLLRKFLFIYTWDPFEKLEKNI